ncbi:MAG TPA: hypothetical protein VIT43_00450 [Candidatus Dormibacteraeota bacterium]
MRTPRRPWWSTVPLASGRLPTRALLLLLALLVLILVAAALSARGVRDLPPAVSAPAAQPTTGGRYIYTPRSGPVSTNVAYRITIQTHCGLDWPIAVDFDGSFWDPTGDAGQGTGNPPSGFGNPTDRGVMTLVNRDTAVYRSEHGSVVQFRRHPGPRAAVPCY